MKSRNTEKPDTRIFAHLPASPAFTAPDFTIHVKSYPIFSRNGQTLQKWFRFSPDPHGHPVPSGFCWVKINPSVQDVLDAFQRAYP